METLVGFIALIIAALVYLVPGIIASVRNHHNACAIWVLNIFGGWTTVGWLVALVWSVTKVKSDCPCGGNCACKQESLIK
jgi:hypothetical protein